MKAFLPLAGLLVACALTGAPIPAAAPLPVAVDPARVERLVQLLDDDDFDTRQEADRALRGCGPAAVPLLKRAQATTESVEVRLRLGAVLHALTADDRVPGLIRQLGHERPDARAWADRELRQYGRAALPLLQKELRPDLDAARRQRLERIIADLAPRR